MRTVGKRNASDWTTWMAVHFNLFGMVTMFQVVDTLVFGWAKSIIMDDGRVAGIREDDKTVECAVCGIKGELVLKKDKLGFD